jgi:hypothetical protein
MWSAGRKPARGMMVSCNIRLFFGEDFEEFHGRISNVEKRFESRVAAR